MEVSRSGSRVHTLMLKAIALADLGIKLGTNLLEKLVETSVVWGHSPHTAVGIHGDETTCIDVVE